MRPLVVNFFGGPGIGKSTVAAGIFSKLKIEGFKCELIQEYAKKKTYLDDQKTLGIQSYITAKQYYKQKIVEDSVDIIITDSPIVLGAVYAKDELASFYPYVLDLFNSFDNLNVYLVRDDETHPYQSYGRNQTLSESEEIDREVLKYLKENEIPFRYESGDPETLINYLAFIVKDLVLYRTEREQNELRKIVQPKSNTANREG